MLQFDANLTMLFTEVPFLERFALAKKAGFPAVEYHFPYKYSAADLKSALTKNGLKQVLFNLPPGNWSKGDRGIAACPDRVDEFRAGIPKAIAYALELGVPQMNCLAGTWVHGYDEKKHWSVLVDNVKYAAEALHKHGLRLLIEHINHYDMPGFFLNKADQVASLIEEAGMPNVFMQFDFYHVQREEGGIINTFRKYVQGIGHIQIADNPGRHEPGTGEIDYPLVLREIDASDYQGYVGLEYIPASDTMSSLEWMAKFGYRMEEYSLSERSGKI
jgi:hydroxypyruvate isomerase